MPQITNLEAVGIAQVAIYGIFLLFAIWLFGVEGLWINAAWFFVILFCILRIVGGSLSIATIGNPGPTNLLIGAAICSFVGLSLLFLVALELVRRVNARSYKYYRPWVETSFNLYSLGQHLLVLAAFIIGVIGGIQAANHFLSTGIFSFNILLEVSSILLVVVFVSILGSCVFATLNWRRKYLRNRALFAAVVVSLPLLLIRLIYNVMAFIAKDIRFNPFTGNFGFFVGMSFVMEILAIAIYIWGGLVNFARRKRRVNRSRSTSSKSRSDRSGSRQSKSRNTSHHRSERESAAG